MSLQTVNYELVDLLRPFFWHKNDILPGGGCPWKLCAPDGDPDPAFWVDNSGDAFSVGDIWIAAGYEFGMSATDGRFGFYDGWGSTADDLVILYDADFRVWDGEAHFDYDVTISGNLEAEGTANFNDIVTFWEPATFTEDAIFQYSVYSELITLADDTATYSALGGYGRKYGIMFLWPRGSTYMADYAVVLFCVATTASATVLHAGAEVDVITGTGSLGGTTGTDGKLTVLVTTFGERIYIENRRGASRNLAMLYIGSN